LSIYGTVFDLAGKKSRIQEINELMASPNFWDDQEKAQGTVGELSRINGTIKPLEELSRAADDLSVLMEFAEEDKSSETELEQALHKLEPQVDAIELKAIMSEPQDASGAYLKVQAGEGGTDASDWAEMLLRMYLRWAEIQGFQVELLERSDAEEAGIRNATIAVRGEYAYGYLKGESGNHRLIRISPFDAAGRRQTSFAAVDVTPEPDDDLEIEVEWDNDKIIREDTYRAGGAGGQHVNKTDSAIRLTHIPTNTVVQCQNERSQHKNRATARKMMIAKLYQAEVDKREAEIAARHGQKSKIGFGGETARHYVLHPEQYVKDTRSGHKAGNPTAVLDGDLEPFIEAYLRWSISKN
jgi:peptide chain release factor 2